MKQLLAALGIAACAVIANPDAKSAAQPTSGNRWLLQANAISKDISGLFVQDTGGSLRTGLGEIVS
jgi:hypothetical protein